MKKKNTIINFRQLSKRILSVALSVVMIGNMTDVSALAVGAKTTQEEKIEISVSEDNMNIPDTLAVTAETTQTENEEETSTSIKITKQPSIDQNKSTVLENYTEAPTLTIEAEDTTESGAELTYQWYQTTSDGTEGSATETAVSGATESTYQIPAGLAPGTYQYYCTVSCGESSVKSDAVTFTVTQAVVKIVETKADGTTKETYYADWADAMTYLSYSSEGEFEGVEKAEIILLQDTECSVSVVNSIGDFDGHFPKEIIIRSEEECHELSGGTVLKAVYDTTHVYMKNIKVEGSIDLSGGATLTLDEKTEVVAKSKADTFEVKESKLIIGDAKVSAGIELISSSTLEVKQGAVISGPSGASDEQINVTGAGNTAVLEAGAATPVFYGDGELGIYCKNDTADWSTSLKTTTNKKSGIRLRFRRALHCRRMEKMLLLFPYTMETPLVFIKMEIQRIIPSMYRVKFAAII